MLDNVPPLFYHEQYQLNNTFLALNLRSIMSFILLIRSLIGDNIVFS